MRLVSFLLFLNFCSGGHIGDFSWELKRIQRHIPYLIQQIAHFQYGTDTFTPRGIAALRKYHPNLPPNLKKVPTTFQADNIPFPELRADVPKGRNPLYFPQRGQEFDVLGRRNPVYIPFQVPQFPKGTTYFPFDRKTLKLVAPQFKIAIPTGLDPPTGRTLPVFPALQDDMFRLVRSPQFSIPDPQKPTDPKFPIVRHFRLVEKSAKW